jgi:hypothetical protein
MKLTELEKNSLTLDHAMELSRTSHPWVVFLAGLSGTKIRISTIYDPDTIYTVYQFFGRIYK